MKYLQKSSISIQNDPSSLPISSRTAATVVPAVSAISCRASSVQCSLSMSPQAPFHSVLPHGLRSCSSFVPPMIRASSPAYACPCTRPSSFCRSFPSGSSLISATTCQPFDLARLSSLVARYTWSHNGSPTDRGRYLHGAPVRLVKHSPGKPAMMCW